MSAAMIGWCGLLLSITFFFLSFTFTTRRKSGGCADRQMQMSAAPTLSPALFRRNPQFVLIMQGALAKYKLTQSSQAQAVTDVV